MYKKYEKTDQKLMAAWAADCAERVLPLFEKTCPKDDRPRKAIEQCREWVRYGIFSMVVIRGASLSAHAAAREAPDEATRYAARAAGQAVATAHVPQHAFGAAYYALKAIASAEPANAQANVAREWEWEVQRAPENLKDEIQKRILIKDTKNGPVIKIFKDADY